MHYLEREQYTYLAGEINALYHEAAVKMGISDSVQNILYVLCEKGRKMPAKRDKQAYRYQPPDNQFCCPQIRKRGHRISGAGERQKYHSLPD